MPICGFKSCSIFWRKNPAFHNFKPCCYCGLKNRSISAAASRQSTWTIFSVSVFFNHSPSTKVPCPAHGPHWNKADCKCERFGSTEGEAQYVGLQFIALFRLGIVTSPVGFSEIQRLTTRWIVLEVMPPSVWYVHSLFAPTCKITAHIHKSSAPDFNTQ